MSADPEKTYHCTIRTRWEAVDIVELTEDQMIELRDNPGRLGEWADQVDASGASLVDWEHGSIEEGQA